jgi:predicted patatin/cPLA2 family phospholipase
MEMLVAMVVVCVWQAAIQIAVDAPSLLYLDGGVADAIPLADQAVDLVDQGVTI